MKENMFWVLLIAIVCGTGVFDAYADDSDLGFPQTPLCADPPNDEAGIDQSGYVNIGGIRQWLTIKGDSCKNPVVLFVHGGPGNPLSPYADSLYGEWQSEFTIVQWDQRGSGKTYQANQEPGELTIEKLNRHPLDIETLTKDGLDVVDYLLRSLGQEKIIITGASWGSVLSAKMIDRSPDKFHFYVGLSPLVNTVKNLSTSYKKVLERATDMQQSESIERLEEMGAPPWSNPRNFGSLRREIRRYETPVVDPGPEWTPEPSYSDEAARNAYYAGEDFSYLKFVGLNGDGMAAGISLDTEHLSFSIPVYFIQGEEDLLALPAVTDGYFQAIDAPKKLLIRVGKAGHDTNYSMLAAHFKALKDGAALLPRAK